MLAVLVLHPDVVSNQNQVSDNNIHVAAFDNNLSVKDTYCYQFVRERKWTNEDRFVGLLLTMGSFFVSVLLVYGAVKGHAWYLMPFFCLQVFDFSVSCLTVVGYFSYLPDLKHCLAIQSWIPYKDRLMSMDGDWLMMLAILIFVLILSLKAYFLGVVWACYKYLCMNSVRGLSRSNGRQYETSGGEDAEMLLPPKYEDAVRMTQEQPPPPPYFPN